MQGYKTLIILDWDDTLFPTNWLVTNNIDLEKIKKSLKTNILFKNLDRSILKLLQNFNKYGDTVIVTNAMQKWINLTLKVLPYTKKYLSENANHIKIISARDIHQEEHPNNIDIWKKLVFKDLVDYYFKKYKRQNIVSVGDAEYEFNALTDLYDQKSVTNMKILKTVRLLKQPTFNLLLDQLSVLNKSVPKVCSQYRHMDLFFEPKK